uniref:Uncharacterized protein n=1 Tax=Kalanchoe fedtschenkoi TaxID=63787 RepID=A0A7N0TI40_KALFE
MGTYGTYLMADACPAYARSQETTNKGGSSAAPAPLGKEKPTFCSKCQLQGHNLAECREAPQGGPNDGRPLTMEGRGRGASVVTEGEEVLRSGAQQER